MFQQQNHIYSFIPALDAIEVDSTTARVVIVAFGDSITQQSEWTKPLAAKLFAGYQDRVVLMNKGIGGNRILRPGKDLFKVFDDAAKDRLERDVLGVPAWPISFLDYRHPRESLYSAKPDRGNVAIGEVALGHAARVIFYHSSIHEQNRV